MSPLNISFAEPRNGWVPVSLGIGKKEFEFVASDVPNNPIEDLVNAVFDVFEDREAMVWWHLEPAGYYFELRPKQDQLKLRVLFTDDSCGQQRTEVASVSGNKQEIHLPLWRALRKFQSFGAVEPHWPEVRYGKLESFGEQLRANQS